MFGSGGAGGDSGAGGAAGHGGNGGSAQGGAIYNTGALTLIGNTFSSDAATAGHGGDGANNKDDFYNTAALGYYGQGAVAGGGGPSGVWILAENGGDGPPTHTGGGSGGDAGSAGGAGSPGLPGSGGSAAGGSLYDANATTASGNTFTSDGANGGKGGVGGDGGSGANGQFGGNQYDIEDDPNPFGASPGANSSPTPGANGTSGGSGGNADSGAFVGSSAAETSALALGMSLNGPHCPEARSVPGRSSEFRN